MSDAQEFALLIDLDIVQNMVKKQFPDVPHNAEIYIVLEKEDERDQAGPWKKSEDGKHLIMDWGGTLNVRWTESTKEKDDDE